LEAQKNRQLTQQGRVPRRRLSFCSPAAVAAAANEEIDRPEKKMSFFGRGSRLAADDYILPPRASSSNRFLMSAG
jgi:hypothetical protein